MMRLRSVLGLAAVILAVCAGGTPVLAQGGAFEPTGSLVDGGRAWHFAVRLTDGRVFVAGGSFPDHASFRTSYEIYDPTTGTWSRSGDMSTGRTYATANLLSDGRVFIAGGSNSAAAYNSTEIWNPATGTFSDGNPMSVVRFVHTATTLADGRILVTGGNDKTDGPVAWSSAEIYDPSTPAWTATGSMTVARQGHKAVRLADGRVLVVGGDQGATNGYTPTTTCEIYDPVTGTFSATGSMSTRRGQPGLVLLADGRALVAGGTKYGADYAFDAEIFDPVTGTWSSAGSLTSGGPSGTLTMLSDGRVLSAGGFDAPFTSQSTNKADLFDPATDTFTPLPDMANRRYLATATLLIDGNVLIAGGADVSEYPYDTEAAELFVPEVVNAPPVANAGADQTVEAIGPAGASVTLDGSGSSDPEDDTLSYSWSGPFGTVTGVSPEVSLALGTHTITLTVDDGNGESSSDDVVVVVQDTTDPVITSLSADPSVLEKANHEMVAVTLTAVASDICDPAPVCSILSVTSNEAVTGPGDETSPDWEVTGALTLNVRAERLGSGSGRIYTIVVLCQDASGNSTTQSVTVTVPRKKK